MTKRINSTGRSLFATLALVAVALVLLRPACELWFSHVGAIAGQAQSEMLATAAGHSDIDVRCCATVSDPSSTFPLQVAPGSVQATQGSSLAGFFVVATGTALALWQPHWLRAPPRTPQSFYLRSTRILR